MVGTLTAERAQAEVSTTLGELRRRHWLPVTIGYVTSLVVVSVIFAKVTPDVQGRILAATSTNLHNLHSGHVGTLLSSGFVIGDNNSSITNIPLLACLVALVELRFGAMHTIRTFLAGHVGATLLVAVGLWVGVRMHWETGSVAIAEDVGVSYGTMALFGSLIVIVPKRRRIPWAAVWLLIALKGVVDIHDFTSFGHLLSYLIGTAIGVLVIVRGRVAPPRMSWFDVIPLVAASALAVSFLLD